MILAFAVFSAGLLVIALGLIVKARRRAVVTGLDHLLGSCAPVESVQAGVPWVRLEGELWEASCGEPLSPNDTVTVDAIDGLTLKVSKAEGGSK